MFSSEILKECILTYTGYHLIALKLLFLWLICYKMSLNYNLYNTIFLKILFALNYLIILILNISYTIDLLNSQDIYESFARFARDYFDNVEFLVISLTPLTPLTPLALKVFKKLIYLYICLFLMLNILVIRFGTSLIIFLSNALNK